MNPVDRAVEHAKSAKSAAFKGNLFGRNMPTVVEFFRRGLPVATIHIRGANRDAGISVAEFGSFAFNAELLFMSSDVYIEEGILTAEMEGKDPREVLAILNRDGQHGDLQRRWEAGDRAGLMEALAICEIPRSGTPSVTHIPYTVTPGKRSRLHYRNRVHMDAAVGFVSDKLVDAIQSPNITEHAMRLLGPKFLDMDEDERFATGDAVAMAALPMFESRVMVGMLYSETGDVKRREILDKLVGQ